MTTISSTPRRGASGATGATGAAGAVGAQGPQGPAGTSGFKDRIWFALDDTNPVFTVTTASECKVPYILYDATAPFNGKAYGMWFRGDWGEGFYFSGSDDGITWDAEVAVTGLTLGTDGPSAPVVNYNAGRSPKYIICFWYADETTTLWASQKYADSEDGLAWSNEQAMTGVTFGVNNDYKRCWGWRDMIYNATATNTGTDPRDYSYMAYVDFGGAWADDAGSDRETIGVIYSADAKDWTFHGICFWGGRLFDTGDMGDVDDTLIVPPYSYLMFNASIGRIWNYNTAYFNIWKESDTLYRALYGGGCDDSDSAVGQAISFDGMNWHDLGLSVEFPNCNSHLFVESYCSKEIESPNLIKVGDDYVAFFEAGTPSVCALGRATERTS